MRGAGEAPAAAGFPSAPWPARDVDARAGLAPPAGDAVHLWLFALDAPAQELRALAAVLAEDERARAARFHFAQDRDRYVAGRGRLRRLLGAYLGRAPQALTFGYGPAGKPFLAAPREPLAFNLSHSAGWALLAVAAPGPALGVDLEEVRALPERDAIAARHFAPAECAALAGLPEPRRDEGFCACWTAKEAFVKADGAGLGIDLAGFVVEVDPDRPARLLNLRGDAAAARAWTLLGGAPVAGFRAALARQAPAAGVVARRLAAPD